MKTRLPTLAPRGAAVVVNLMHTVAMRAFESLEPQGQTRRKQFAAFTSIKESARH